MDRERKRELVDRLDTRTRIKELTLPGPVIHVGQYGSDVRQLTVFYVITGRSTRGVSIDPETGEKWFKWWTWERLSPVPSRVLRILSRTMGRS